MKKILTTLFAITILLYAGTAQASYFKQIKIEGDSGNVAEVDSNGNVYVTVYDSSGNEIESQLLDSVSDDLDGKYGLVTASGMYGRTDGIVRPVQIDASTHSLIAMSYEHHEIHDGNHFNYCDYSLGEAVGATIEFVLTTPNTTKWIHFNFTVASTDGATIELYEGTSGITAGTAITPRNNNRNSLTASGVTLIKDPTAITSDGVRASGYLAGGGRVSGVITRDTEYMLGQNRTYLMRITSLANGNDISWAADWYEHTDKN